MLMLLFYVMFLCLDYYVFQSMKTKLKYASSNFKFTLNKSSSRVLLNLVSGTFIGFNF